LFASTTLIQLNSIFLEAILKSSIPGLRTFPAILFLSLLALLVSAELTAQQTQSKIEGNIADVQGKAVARALVTVKNEATGALKTTSSDGNGAYAISGLTAGTYTVEASANGFALLTRNGVALTAGQALELPLSLNVSSVAEQVTVNAGIDSIAAESAPSGGFIEERSAQSLVSNTYIENFTSPIADFGEIVQIVPGTFTTRTATTTSTLMEFPSTTPIRRRTTHGRSFHRSGWAGWILTAARARHRRSGLRRLAVRFICCRSRCPASRTFAARFPMGHGIPSSTTGLITRGALACSAAPRSRTCLSMCTI
jgi:hypothetical protein